MSESEGKSTGPWADGELPKNAVVARDSVIIGRFAFKRFLAKNERALVMGSGCTMDGVQFSVADGAQVSIGDCCYFTSVILMAELEIRIGSYVMIGWNTAIADSDFHPIGPAERLQDALACSPLGKGRPRPPVARKAVIIEDDVWIGPGCTILKGVTIGAGSFIEPGSVITRDVPAASRVMGNPAKVIGRTHEPTDEHR
jgi:acetyltransferase-like isoleucine patch superfamily enzyme